MSSEPPNAAAIRRATGSPSPTPGWPSRAGPVGPVERFEHPGGSSLESPDPRSSTASKIDPGSAQQRTVTGDPAGLYLKALSEEIVRDLPEEQRVDADSQGPFAQDLDAEV